MTAPVVDITEVVPSKIKTWIGLIGSLLTFVVPYALQYAVYLPDPWPVVIGAVIAALTALGIYKAPYTPDDATVVKNDEIKAIGASDPINVNIPGVPNTPVLDGKTLPPEDPGQYRNPWK